VDGVGQQEDADRQTEPPALRDAEPPHADQIRDGKGDEDGARDDRDGDQGPEYASAE
jgi:hypothetical protein